METSYIERQKLFFSNVWRDWSHLVFSKTEYEARMPVFVHQNTQKVNGWGRACHNTQLCYYFFYRKAWMVTSMLVCWKINFFVVLMPKTEMNISLRSSTLLCIEKGKANLCFHMVRKFTRFKSHWDFIEYNGKENNWESS